MKTVFTHTPLINTADRGEKLVVHNLSNNTWMSQLFITYESPYCWFIII